MMNHSRTATSRLWFRSGMVLLASFAAGCSTGGPRTSVTPADLPSGDTTDSKATPAAHTTAARRDAAPEADPTPVKTTLVAFPEQTVAAESVSVTFGSDAKDNGIRTWAWGTGASGSIATYDGKSGLQTDLANGVWGIWGDVRDSFINGGTNHVKVSIEYWDKRVRGEPLFKLYYDSVQRPMARAPVMFFDGTNTWKTATAVLENARFGNRQEGGADFRLFSTDTNLCVHSITIEKIPSVVPTTEVTVVPESATIVEGERKNLFITFAPSYATDKFVTWSSSDSSVAEVNRYGQVLGKADGTATITARTDSGLESTCMVTVYGVPGTGVIAQRAGTFLDSIGVNSSISGRGEKLEKTLECMEYLGARWIRSGLGLPIEHYRTLNRAAGIRFSLSFGGDINRFVRGARRLEAEGLVLAFEGPNEPNNWGLTYQDVKGGGRDSWVPIAKLQRDFYAALKADPVLREYPVWHLSEGGAEIDNVGLQFLAIPKGAGIAMPDGTQYSDYACCHNYCCHPGWPGLHDNQTWVSSDPSSKCRVDGLYVEYGRAWAKKFPGYSEADLEHLPRVTTETGITLSKEITEEIQARLYLGVYLAQFTRGWTWTSMYILRDRVDEGGNQTFGFYRPDYTPRRAALYLHNMTTILADDGYIDVPGRLDYTIAGQPDTVHDLLLQKSDGRYCLVVWGERFKSKATDRVTVRLGRTFRSVKMYDPTVGTDAVRTLTDVDSVDLELVDNPVIIELYSASQSELELLSQGLPKTSYTGGRNTARGGNEPDKAFDGNTRTAFCNGPAYPAWIQVDLGREFTIVKTMAFMERTGTWYSYKVEVSTDGTNWTTFADHSKNRDPSHDPSYTDMGRATGRYVRYTMIDAKDSDKSWHWPVVKEFKVYGLPAGR